MDDLTAEQLEDTRAFVKNEDGSHPDLSDLPAMWDAIEPDKRMPEYPGYSLRTFLLARNLNFSHTKRWAWDGLDRLHRVLMERREPIPEILQEHVNLAYAGLRTAPNKPRNPNYAPKDGRDMRIMRAYRVLLESGWPEQEAKDQVMLALDYLDAETVRSIFRKMRTFGPFKPATKRAK